MVGVVDTDALLSSSPSLIWLSWGFGLAWAVTIGCLEFVWWGGVVVVGGFRCITEFSPAEAGAVTIMSPGIKFSFQAFTLPKLLEKGEKRNVW